MCIRDSTSTIILAAGSMFILWLGERITDKGIGNGCLLYTSGQEVDKLKEELKKITDKDIQINIFEVKRPELAAVIDVSYTNLFLV